MYIYRFVIKPSLYAKIIICMGHKSKRYTNYRLSPKIKNRNGTKVIGLRRNNRLGEPILKCIYICTYIDSSSEFSQSKNNKKTLKQKNRDSDPLLNYGFLKCKKFSGTGPWREWKINRATSEETARGDTSPKWFSSCDEHHHPACLSRPGPCSTSNGYSLFTMK